MVEEVISMDATCETWKEKEVDGDQLTLDQLPPEILVRICDFLDARIIHELKLVCKVFEELFTGDVYFKMRIHRRWPKKYPAVSFDDLDWQEACAQREDAHTVWTNHNEHLEHFRYSNCLLAPVDVIHLMKGGHLLAAGSRDRCLTILDLDKYDPMDPKASSDMQIYSDFKAHQGWIWSLDSQDNILATGSWDAFIKLWDLNAGVASVNAYKCKSAILDLCIDGDLIIAGAYDKKVYTIDRRRRTMAKMKYHHKPILCIAVDDKYVITGSEDKTICVFDRTAHKVFKKIELSTYPLDLSYGNNQLWFGDKKGQLWLMDTTNGAFDVVESYDVGHTGELTGVVHTLGAIYTSSLDHTVKVVEPSRDPATITTLKSHQDGVTGISYQNGVLASGGCDVSVSIWRPKEHMDIC